MRTALAEIAFGTTAAVPAVGVCVFRACSGRREGRELLIQLFAAAILTDRRFPAGQQQLYFFAAGPAKIFK